MFIFGRHSVRELFSWWKIIIFCIFVFFSDTFFIPCRLFQKRLWIRNFEITIQLFGIFDFARSCGNFPLLFFICLIIVKTGVWFRIRKCHQNIILVRWKFPYFRFIKNWGNIFGLALNFYFTWFWSFTDSKIEFWYWTPLTFCNYFIMTNIVSRVLVLI